MYARVSVHCAFWFSLLGGVPLRAVAPAEVGRCVGRVAICGVSVVARTSLLAVVRCGPWV